jgi:hypothetical protein
MKIFDFSYFANQIAHFVAVEFGNRRNAVNITDQVGLTTEERLERGLACDSCQKAAVGRDPQFFDLRRAPIFTEQTAEYR